VYHGPIIGCSIALMASESGNMSDTFDKWINRHL
jgi:hypothetical protein